MTQKMSTWNLYGHLGEWQKLERPGPDLDKNEDFRPDNLLVAVRRESGHTGYTVSN